MFHGCRPSCLNNQAVLDVKVWVLPLPGPARIARVRAVDETAALWDELRFASIVSDNIILSRRRQGRIRAYSLELRGVRRTSRYIEDIIEINSQNTQ